MLFKHHFKKTYLLITLLFLSAPTFAEPVQGPAGPHIKYMALGDSLAAGYKAMPATNGYVYLLYRSGAIAPLPQLLFADAAVPGVTSGQVLAYQVPQAVDVFKPDVVTLTVGGNDLLTILEGADPATVLTNYQNNLATIFQTLRTRLPNARIYVSNLYVVPQIPGAEQTIPILNQIIAQVANAFGVPVADIYTPFQGHPELLLINHPGYAADEIHPTNAGYRIIEQQFAALMKTHGDD